MGLKSKVDKWRKYSEMSNLGIIARRKFFNNAFDGALTCAGIVSGNFIIFLSNISDPTKNLLPTMIIITGLSTALAIGISGLWGAFLSEEAERKKKLDDLKKEMVILKEKIGESGKEVIEHDEIQKAMINPINYDNNLENEENKVNYDSSSDKSLIERSEKFATIIASLVDGGAPVLGSVLPLLPFFFGTTLSLFHFIISYAVLVGILVYLGIFLGNISGGGNVREEFLSITLFLVTLSMDPPDTNILNEFKISLGKIGNPRFKE